MPHCNTNLAYNCQKTKRRICLFGTSANPPTGKGGHVGIVKYLASLPWSGGEVATVVQENKNQIICSDSFISSGQQPGQQQQSTKHRFHEVRVLPVYKHMFDEKRENQASFDDRLTMCRLAFQDIPNVVVSDDERRCFDWVAKKQGITTTEEKMKLRVGTADLLDMLLEQNHDSFEITLALGADTFMDLTNWKWKRSKDIIRLIEGRMIVFHRIFHGDESVNIHVDNDNNYNSGNGTLITEEDILDRIQIVSDTFQDTCPNMKDHIMLVKSPCLSSVSSSKVRNCTREEDMLIFVKEEQLDQQVFAYIKEKKLYGFHSTNQNEE